MTENGASHCIPKRLVCVLDNVRDVLRNLEAIESIRLKGVNPVMDVRRVRTMPSDGCRTEGLGVTLVRTVCGRRDIRVTPLNFGCSGGPA